MSTNKITVSNDTTEVIFAWARPSDRIAWEVGEKGYLSRGTENEMINATEELMADLERAIKRAKSAIASAPKGQRNEIRCDMRTLNSLLAEASWIAVPGRAAQAAYWSSPERSWNGGAS